MASVIIEGGSNPIECNSWQNSLKIELMHQMYHDGRLGGSKDDLFRCIDRHLETVWITYGHSISADDIVKALGEMFREGWIEVAGTKCECCLSQKIDHTNLMKHATRFRLTRSGYDRVPEHIFP